MTADTSDQALTLAMFRTLLGEKGNWLDFASFMHHALYDSKYGYYTGEAHKFGPRGDFITAPEISDLFGRTIARQVAQVLKISGGGVLELGGGSGILGSDILVELNRLECPVEEYLLFEPSPTLTRRQKERVAQLAPAIRAKVHWVSELPTNFKGVILANEVFDALPVHLLSRNDEGWKERGVVFQNESLVWRDNTIEDERLISAINHLNVDAPYVTEVCLAVNGLVANLAETLDVGAVLAIDYGYEHQVYYHPDRRDGTLSCHYHHRVDSDPLDRPGSKDITAHVDFTRVANAAMDAGLEVSGYVTQADFLVNCGITDLLQAINPDRPEEYLPSVSAVQKLLSPAIMGDMFKVMFLSRGINEPLVGFSRRDRRHLL
ncbi:MAG: SAM-dependent methyltransferase [Proteobacteria bacterium]|nr:SAM-dependent methyltransferase [Pseudomonadota bacterium]